MPPSQRFATLSRNRKTDAALLGAPGQLRLGADVSNYQQWRSEMRQPP